ncbi:MAG: 1-acyl-sn-glycerol-3-phosphate acyltransferase [Actinobacteria bacterium]|nr:1-acyl-sn-glycerol-3-phosphate acyltransferase [Actinomycetota bacterium]
MTPIGSLRSASQSRRLLAPLLRSWYRPTVLGVETLPRRGAVIFVANHLGFLDAALLSVASPRPLRTLAPDELFEPPLDRVAKVAGHISMDPTWPDLAAMAAATQVLRAGEALAVFPEGRRGDGRVASIRHEAAYLALTTDTPVVPTAILGTRQTGMAVDALPRRKARMAVVFDQPFTLSSHGDVYRRCVVAAAGETIRQRLADHVGRASYLTGLRLPDDRPDVPATPERTHPDAR